MGNSSTKPIVYTDEVNLNHFRLLRVVGKGAFGKVRIVERKDTGLTFALKYIRKDEVVRSESVRNIIRERRMLEHLNHPFLCNLRYSFQDIEYLYIVVDLMNGGDLRFHISRKTFTEEAVRYWVAELGCALKYIHTQGIVHRDVKPDNVLLDSDGHAHLADFNVASDYTPAKLLTSKSGTLAYLAPEVYQGRGYLSEVDWWSLGVLFYECIYNKRPFEASSHDSLAQKIVKGDPAFPVTSPPVSMPCLHAISSLLEKDRKRRIGATGFHTFTDNPFMREIDFDALLRKEIEPVFRPSSEKTNFDATYDLEELLLEEAPLEARARRQKPREALKDDATDQEIRADELHKMVETLFEPFNYTTVTYDKTAAAALQAAGGVIPHATESTISNPDPSGDPSTAAALPTITTPAQEEPPSASSLRPSKSPLHRTRSARSPGGSPPLAASALATADPSPRTAGGATTNSTTRRAPRHAAGPEYFPPSEPGGDAVHPPPSFSRPRPAGGAPGNPAAAAAAAIQGTPTTAAPAGAATGSSSSSQPASPRQARGSTRSTSMGGGMQVVLNEEGTGSWAEMGQSKLQKQGVPDESAGRPTGMLGFLSRKKGRDRSPKAKERGVLGKEGARVVISNG